MTELLQEAIAQIQKLPNDRNTRPIWEQFAEFTDSLPEDAIVDLPPDGAANVDRYLYPNSSIAMRFLSSPTYTHFSDAQKG